MAEEMKLVKTVGEIEHIILGFMILRKETVEYNVNFLLTDIRRSYAAMMQRYRSLTNKFTAKTNKGISVTTKKNQTLKFLCLFLLLHGITVSRLSFPFF